MWIFRIASACALALAGSAAFAAPTLEQLRARDARHQFEWLQPAPATDSLARAPEAIAPRIEAAEMARVADSDPVLAAKWLAVEQHERLLRTGGLAPTPAWQDASSRATRIAIGAGAAPGRECERALPVRVGEALRVEADAALAASGLWLELRSEDGRPVMLSTRGSSVDARLRAYADCRERGKPALAEVDDNLGLQAELALVPRHAGQFWRVHVAHDGQGELVLAPVAGEVISGRVTRESNGAPIVGVTVVAFNAQGGYVSAIQTDTDGRYSLGSLQGPGTYFVRTGTTYYAEQINWLHEAYGGARCESPDAYYLTTCTNGTLTPIAVALGQVVAGIDLSLGTGAIVEGTVRDARTHLPIATASVYVHGSTGNLLRTLATDAAGRYRASGLLGGAVRVAARDEGHRGEVYSNIPCNSDGCPILAGQALSISIGSTTRADFDLDPWAYIEATVEFTPGISGAGDVFVATAGGTLLSSYFIYNESGSRVARLGPLEPGSYRLAFRGADGYFGRVHAGIDCPGDCSGQVASGTPVEITSFGQQLAVTIQPRPWPLVRGQVLDQDSGLPIGAAQVAFYNAGSSYRSATTGADGRYTLSLPIGSFLLHANSNAHANEAYPEITCENPALPPYCPGAAQLGATLGASDLTINFALARHGEAFGTVRYSQLPYYFSPVVRPIDSLGRAVVDAGLYVIGSDGSFRVQDIPPGTYYFGAANYGALPQVHPAIDCPASYTYGNEFVNCSLASAQSFAVTNTTPATGLSFNLRAEGSRPGRVVRADTLAPIPGVAIDLWTPAGDHVQATVSDAQGRFAVVGPQYTTGTYVLSTDTGWPYVNQVYSGIACPNGSVYAGLCSLAGATSLTLPVSGTGGALIDIRLGLQPNAPFFIDGFE